MHFVWCESVENFFRDKTLLRERKSVCVSQIQRYYSLCVHFSLIMVLEKYSFGLKFPLLILVQKEQVETNPLCRIAMLWPSKAGVF